MMDSIAGMIFFIIIATLCCAAIDSPSESSNTTQKRNNPPKRTVSYTSHSYSECPSCGAPYYDGYCDECGYPDVNQGWLGEEYGDW
ncbi:MAG: hypothetical protein ACSW71_02175 [Methanobrevibacter sp.]